MQGTRFALALRIFVVVRQSDAEPSSSRCWSQSRAERAVQGARSASLLIDAGRSRRRSARPEQRSPKRVPSGGFLRNRLRLPSWDSTHNVHPSSTVTRADLDDERDQLRPPQRAHLPADGIMNPPSHPTLTRTHGRGPANESQCSPKRGEPVRPLASLVDLSRGPDARLPICRACSLLVSRGLPSGRRDLKGTDELPPVQRTGSRQRDTSPPPSTPRTTTCHVRPRRRCANTL